MIDRKSSYTVANVFPIKLLKHKNVPDGLGKIPPIHIQLIPTNVCNLNCDFCLCSNRNRKLEIEFERLKFIMDIAVQIGCKAVTITGGGEPLLYSRINELISYLHDELNVQVGMVSNGTMFDRLDLKTFKKIKWLRISHSDLRPFDAGYRKELTTYISAGDRVDWSFAYVVSNKPDFDNICQVVKYANDKHFTHVRIVSDLVIINNAPDMRPITEALNFAGISDDIVIMQNRTVFARGQKNCLHGLLKPVIGVDGNLYSCCGIPYANDPPHQDYNESMSMGSALINLYQTYWEQIPFDGSQCVRCYYDNYNKLLEQKTLHIEHSEFL